MFINEVEHVVKLSKKSIRYYEELGLINPKRNVNNDYRVYNEDDISRLKIIKFLRELGVTTLELKLLNDGSITLKECMIDRTNKIKKEEEKYKKVISMCEEISKSNDTYNDIDISKYFEEINILNKEGFTMRNVNYNKSKKIVGAICSSIIFSLFFVFMIGLFIYLQNTETDKLPWILFSFFMFIFGFPIVGIIYNLIIRIKEIKGGEEDEASKY